MNVLIVLKKFLTLIIVFATEFDGYGERGREEERVGEREKERERQRGREQKERVRVLY